MNSQFVSNPFPDGYNGFGPDGQGVMIFVRGRDLVLKDNLFEDNPGQKNCHAVFSQADLYSLGGNTFEDRSCNPSEEGVVLE